MTQCDIILNAMLQNPQVEWWYAKDFQGGEHFVGYEATARMSDLLNLYPALFRTAKDGRFRVIGIDWSNVQDCNFHIKRLQDIKDCLRKEEEYE